MANDDIGKEEETKLCGACLQEFPNENFSKKQWQQKQRRRCKECADSGKEINVSQLNVLLPNNEEASSTTNNGSSSRECKKKKEKGKKDTPIYAGSLDGRYQPHCKMKLASDICAWCGKSEENEKLMKCSACKNIMYCSRTCQKAAYPEHKAVCDKMKQDRKESKKDRKASAKQGDYCISEASGVGSFYLEYRPGPGGFSSMVYRGELRGDEQPGQYFASEEAREGVKRLMGAVKFSIFCCKMEEASLDDVGTFNRTEFFTNVEELSPIDQFLLSCGPLNDIQRAKDALPHVLHQISLSGLKPDGSIPNIGDITVRGYGLNALEWASRRGNFKTAEWLATDSRTRVMLTCADSAPVAWACYTNKVELAKMLVKHGADSRSTTEVVFGHKPPSHLASENGQLLALKYLVEECGHDIHECDMEGQDIRVSLRCNNKAWASTAGCIATDEYAKSKGVLGEMSATRRKPKVAAKSKQSTLDDKLAAALRQLEIAGGKEEEQEEEDAEEEVSPGDYLSELLAVADARYELGQYSKAASLYYRGYYAALHKGQYINNPAIFPIAHKMIQSWIKAGGQSDLNFAHGMAQQNAMMPGHPQYIREDLVEVERVMMKKGVRVQRFGMGTVGF